MIITDTFNEICLKYKNKDTIRDLTYHNSISYYDLKIKVDTISNQFQKLGLKKGERVLILLKNSINFIVCVFATLKNNAAYIPLPNNYPKERLIKIIGELEPKIIVSETSLGLDLKNSLEVTFSSLIDGTTFINEISDNNDSQYNNGLIDECTHFDDYDVNNIAYIMYTSGTTGNPKGVVIQHKSLINYIERTIIDLELDSTIKTLNVAPFYFDGSVGNIFYTLLVGGTLHTLDYSILLPRVLLKQIIQNEITHIGTTPYVFGLIVKAILERESYTSLTLKKIMIGGETFPKDNARIFKKMYPSVKIFNRYGPTETTVVASGCEITIKDLENEGPISIGKPLENVIFVAYNSQNKIIYPGEIGELLIGGTQVMQKYWKDEELTERVLVRLPNDENLFYKTGDLVTIDDQGKYYIVGRNDDMVKRKGNRIYLSEIDNVIISFDEIEEVKSIFLTPLNLIVTFFVSNIGSMEIGDIRTKVAALIPIHMMPDHFIELKTFPRKNTGKIDTSELVNIGIKKFQDLESLKEGMIGI